MKIALLTDGIYPYVIGGMQKHSFYLAKYFAKNQVYVDMYHTNQSEYDINKLEFFSEEEKKYIRSFAIDFPVKGKLPGHYISESFEYSNRIFNLFKNNSAVDFIYAKGFCAWKLLDEKRKGYKCAPVGVNFHGYEMFQKAPSFKSWIAQRLFFRGPVLFNVQHADRVFSYGGKISDIILKLSIRKEKIIEIPAGIESDWINENIKPVEKKRKFVFVGRYERRKGIEELNTALDEIIHSAEMEMHFIGPILGLKQLTADNIFYHGSVNDPEKMKALLRACDILICPSYSEGMPNVILEAMASGLAVIATDVGAVSLMVSKENGWLLEFPSKEKIQHKILEAVGVPDIDLIAMKEYSVNKVRTAFLWENISRKTIEEIGALVSQEK